MEGLAQNPYIMSNMNDNGFVPMSLVVSYLYPAFPNITVSDIMEAVQSSDKVSVDADTQMIRPNVSVERKRSFCVTFLRVRRRRRSAPCLPDWAPSSR